MRPVIAGLCVCFIAVIFGCGGGSNSGTNETQKLLVSLGFEDEIELDEWEISSEDSNFVSIDNADSYEGESSLQVGPGECVRITMKEDLPVRKGVVYEISFAARRSGGFVGCASAFTLLINQSGNDIMYQSSSIQDGDNWGVKKFYFQAESDVPVRLSIFIGYELVWIDDLEVKVWDGGSNKNEEVIASIGFEDDFALEEWENISGESSSMSISDTDSYEGNYSLQVSPKNCAVIAMKEYLPVTAGSTYHLSITVRRSGPPVGCAGSFILLIRQAGEDLMDEYSPIQNGTNWEIKTFAFQSESEVPVKLRLIIGYETVWIDDIQVSLYKESSS